MSNLSFCAKTYSGRGCPAAHVLNIDPLRQPRSSLFTRNRHRRPPDELEFRHRACISEAMARRRLLRPHSPSRWQPHRCWCLAWLLLAQLPLPIAHSHEHLGELPPAAQAAHLAVHHAEPWHPSPGGFGSHAVHSSPHDEGYHWHWLMPWEISGTASTASPQPDIRPPASPLGWWSTCLSETGCDAAATAAVQLDNCQLPCGTADAVPRWWCLPPPAARPLPCADPQADCLSFGQSYAGISLATLFAVRLV